MMRALLALLVAVLLVAPAYGDWYYRGDTNSWGATPMTDNLDGTFSITVTGTPGTFTAWKHSQAPDTWDWPGSGNSWAYFDGDGNLTITLDTNVYADGWMNTEKRVNISHDGVSQWAAVGDFNGWNNNDSAMYMSAVGGGVYEVQATIATPGEHWYKAVSAGSWDAIGADARSVNADNLGFTTTVADEVVIFQVKPLEGVVRVIPEPATLTLLGLGALALIRRR
ncbi:MAG: PEP-CTERM sorting domain-containing protein [Phycisphaerae bacterium]|nr:PEP-CTERM sorting domain-containing protein [Phycisphaerae bacterium]